jgi:chromosome segregation ATPase
MCISDNNVFVIKFCAANIEHYSTSSVNLKLVEYINTYYDTSVMSNTFIDREHDSTIVTVTELSKLQTELAQLSEAHKSALDLSEELDSNINVLKNNLVSLNNQVQNKQDTRDALDQIIVAKRKELDRLKWEITQSDVKLASVKRNYQEVGTEVKTRVQLNENLTKQNAFLTCANNKLRTENEELYKTNKELRINVTNIIQCNTVKIQKKIGEYLTGKNDEVIDITDDTPDQVPNKKIKLYL